MRCGILSAYEKVLTSLYSNGWPADKKIFEFTADEILRHGSQFKQDFKGIIGKDFDKKRGLILKSQDTASDEVQID